MRDTDSRNAQDGSEVDCESGAPGMVEPGRIDEQDIRLDLKARDGRSEDRAFAQCEQTRYVSGRHPLRNHARRGQRSPAPADRSCPRPVAWASGARLSTGESHEASAHDRRPGRRPRVGGQNRLCLDGEPLLVCHELGASARPLLQSVTHVPHDARPADGPVLVQP